MRIAVIGPNGQLGSDLVQVLGKHDLTLLRHVDIEVTDKSSCKTLYSINPEVVINTAAFHRVDDCEANPQAAFAANAIGAKNVAEICGDLGAVYVFISTDYVFDGKKGSPYTESDTPNPINTYGISKLAGEKYAALVDKHYIMRVSSLFGVAGASGKGGNFVETMVKKAKAGDAIKVVNDTLMSPTYTWDAAMLIKGILEKVPTYGIYHLSNYGHCTWYEFTQEIVAQLALSVDLSPIDSASLNQAARRPVFSAMQSEKLTEGNKPRPWKEALTDYLRYKGYI